MPIEPELKALCNQIVGIVAAATVDAYGKRTYKPAVPIACRIRGKTVDVAGPNGTIITGAGTIWLDDHYPDIGANDRVQLPTGGTKGIVEIDHVHDDVGPHHTRLVYGQS